MFNEFSINLRTKLLEWTSTGDRRFYYLAKRIIDLALGLFFLAIFSPLMAIIAILIKLDSPGPVFYKQPRVGARRNSKGEWEVVDFLCFKFRTMKNNADSAVHEAYVKALIQNDHQKVTELQGGHQEVHKLTNDKRITRVGRYLRKLSLDELPQFINVVIGEMSIVGPRPAIRYEVEVYKPWQRGRLRAQPGITGLQQVTARCIGEFDDQVKWDLIYIENQSLWLDFKIMIKTPLAVLKHRGAC